MQLKFAHIFLVITLTTTAPLSFSRTNLVIRSFIGGRINKVQMTLYASHCN